MSEMIDQALVLVGGKGSRLRSGGVTIPMTKAFLPVAGRPLLFWSLYLLYKAGIRDVVIAGEESGYLYRAQSIIESLPVQFKRVTTFQDFGRGVHGLPYYARYNMAETFLVECGHSMSTPEHYRSLIEAKTLYNTVFSAFTTHPSNPRLPLVIDGGQLRIATNGEPTNLALAHPMVVDSAYALSLVKYKFDIKKVLSDFIPRRKVAFVHSELPPEFDTSAEMQLAKLHYERYLTTTGLI